MTSEMALMLATCVGGVLMILLIGLMFKWLRSGMPVLGTCSLAISAACHAAVGDENAATKLLMYGVVGGERDEGDEKKHVCFSSRDVEPLRDGEMYY